MDILVLFKSQRYPRSAKDIRWTGISIFSDKQNLTGVFSRQDQPNFACAVSNAGVFTVLSYRGADEPTLIPVGLQYNPAVAGAAGQWSMVKVAANYYQMVTSPRFEDHHLFYVQDGDKETLHHVSSDFSRAVHIGILSEVDGRSLLYHMITHMNNVLQINSYITSFAYGNGNLFAYAPGGLRTLRGCLQI
ncbi:MAG: hypothetical protein J3R72DRAFT_150387 [Linnemannia gamsii]|nr:MAG: hypothetical protein J3R72DRAFT_150387 [Linnemannia gamsii]